MEIIFSKIHQINVDENNCTERAIEHDATGYIVGLVNEILKNPNKKRYKIRREGTEVVSVVMALVESYLEGEFEDAFNDEDHEECEEQNGTDDVASRLLEKEIKRQDELNLNIKIKKGSLLQALILDDDYIFYMISKIENADILDLEDMYRKSGIPYENKSFKQCLFQFSDELEILNIFLSDKNGIISDYWGNEFLELDELTNDEKNTENIFNVITNKLKSEVENISKVDHVFLRNQVLGYFKTKDTFKLDEFLEYTFGSIIPENSELDIDKVKNSISAKFEAKELDTEFKIIPSAIKSKKLKSIKKVNTAISITLDGYDEEIKSSIKSIEKNGEKYLEIKVTEIDTYNSFNWGNKV
ncbi:hypothetical protein DSECCO2_221520 [anaerobic digester metagenome]